MSRRLSSRRPRPDATRDPVAYELEDTFFDNPDRRHSRFARKDHQLCAQVMRILASALVVLDDELLASLQIDVVEPAPDASRLRVIVQVAAPGEVNVPDLYTRLGRARAHLRAEVAAGITRKRAPELLFELGGTLATDEDHPHADDA